VLGAYYTGVLFH